MDLEVQSSSGVHISYMWLPMHLNHLPRIRRRRRPRLEDHTSMQRSSRGYGQGLGWKCESSCCLQARKRGGDAGTQRSLGGLLGSGGILDCNSAMPASRPKHSFERAGCAAVILSNLSRRRRPAADEVKRFWRPFVQEAWHASWSS